MGKSTLLENLAIQDIRNGEAVAFIDPHGQTAERLLEYVPEHRKKDVVYFAPFDMEHPIAFNVMEDVGYDKRHLVVSGLLNKQIAGEIGASEGTVKVHRSQLMRKMGAESLADLVRMGERMGIPIRKP